MISRVIAEFETADLAELAVKRVKESVDGVYSGNIIRSRMTVLGEHLGHGTSYSVIPTAFNNRTNFMSAVMMSPVSDDIDIFFTFVSNRRAQKKSPFHCKGF